MIKAVYIFLLACVLGCKSDVQHIDKIIGYWEIVSVSKNQSKIKDFKISQTIDYFEITDSTKGYRKKLLPKFDGSFETSQHQMNFKIIKENKRLYLEYQSENTTYREEILRANSVSLIIGNSNGFVYTYKPYEPLEFEE